MTIEWKEITDTEELFRLKREGWEIESYDSFHICWNEWDGSRWNSTAKFHARPRQPKMKKVKLLAWLDPNEELRIGAEFGHIAKIAASGFWIRLPKLDLEGEVPDEQ